MSVVSVQIEALASRTRILLSTQVTSGPRFTDKKQTDNGHVGLGAKAGGDNLFTDFEVLGCAYVKGSSFLRMCCMEATLEISKFNCCSYECRTMYVHDLIVDSEMMTVFRNGSAMNLRADHHRLSPFGTLWTDLDAGKGERLFMSGGRHH